MSEIKNFGINLNFDSLGEAYGWPSGFVEDKAFTKGLDRITGLCRKLDIPITIFVVGKDLENEKNFNILKKISENNDVEIANHSYNHVFNFGSLNEYDAYDEIYKSHKIIYDCTGKECKGFISPTWAISKNIVKNLIKMNYSYDTSFFRSIYLYPMIAKIFLSHILGKKYSKAFKILNRRDYLIPFKYKNGPFFLNSEMQMVSKETKDSILELPMPAINNMQTPVWNTMGYVFGFNYLKKKLKVILDRKKPFFFLIHPADFLDKEDMDSNYSLALERMDKENYTSKLNNLEDVLNLILSNGYKGKKLIEVANIERNK